MKKSTKILLITATALIIAGATVFTCAMVTLGWDFTKLNTVKYETKIFEISEEFGALSADVDSGDIVFKEADDGKCKITCRQRESEPYSVTVNDGVLSISAKSTLKWYGYIGRLDFSSPSMTVYLPKKAYGDIKINGSTGDITLPDGFTFESIDANSDTGDVKCESDVTGRLKISLSTGDIDLRGLSAGEIELKTSTGNMSLRGVECAGDIKAEMSTGNFTAEGVNCESLISGGSTGNVTLKGVTARSSFDIKTSTGNVKFDGADAKTIKAKTSTGDITGTLLGEKIIFAETSTGKTDVPKSSSGGRCELKTSTGDIIISVKK